MCRFPTPTINRAARSGALAVLLIFA